MREEKSKERDTPIVEIKTSEIQNLPTVEAPEEEDDDEEDLLKPYFGPAAVIDDQVWECRVCAQG